MAASPVLYGLERSVYTRIARMALHEKGVDFRLVEVEIFGPEGVPASHRRRHPFGRIPVLEHGDLSVYETAAITRYVDEAFDGPPLQGGDARSRARMNQTIGVLDAYAYRPMVWGVFVARRRAAQEAPDEAAIAQALAAAAGVAQVLEAGLRGHAFLAGDALSLADLHAYPILRCFSRVDEGRDMLARQPGLSRWLAAMAERPSAQTTRTRGETG